MQRIALARLRKELADLEGDPVSGFTCYPVDDSNIAQLEAYIDGPPDTPYENGRFQIAINIPDNYPFDPPQMRFRTKIYHPNIDESGRICADMLKTGEAGAWKPSLNLSTLLISLRALLSSPNPDDPLDADIAREYKLDYPRFAIRAKEHTARYATGEQSTTLDDEDEPPKVWEETQKDEEEETALQEYDQQEMSQSKKSRLSLSSKKRRRVSSPMSQSSTQDNSQHASTSSVPNHTNMNQLASSSLSSSTSPPPPPPSSSSPPPSSLTPPPPSSSSSPSLTSSSPSSKSNVSDKTPIRERQPSPIVFKTINIKPAKDLISPPPTKHQSSLVSKVREKNAVKSSITNAHDAQESKTTKKPTMASTPPNQSSSSKNKEHHANDNTHKDNDSKQSMKAPTRHRISTLILCDDATHDEDVDKKPITLNEAALKEISSNIADDVELVSKPTNSKRNKLSLGKKRRRATQD